ncbi:MAG: class I SAM-dependent methyltransferase [Nitrospiraceae bacterium]
MCTIGPHTRLLVRARREKPPFRAAWVQALADRLPIQSGTFHCVLSGLVLDHVIDLHRFFREVARVLVPGGQAIVSGIHPEMQRLTGPAVRFRAGESERCLLGMIHATVAITEAIHQAGLTLLERHEPVVDARLVARRPQWNRRLGVPALLLLALSKEPGTPIKPPSA